MPTADTIRFTKLADSLSKGLVNFEDDLFGCLLLADLTLGTLQDDAQFVADVLAAGTEATGTAYTPGGLTLNGTTWTQDGSTFVFDADDPLWAASTIDAAFALWFDKTPGTDATNPVIGLWDFGGTKSSTATDFSLIINASGLVTI
jgi:hypothetical protein